MNVTPTNSANDSQIDQRTSTISNTNSLPPIFSHNQQSHIGSIRMNQRRTRDTLSENKESNGIPSSTNDSGLNGSNSSSNPQCPSDHTAIASASLPQSSLVSPSSMPQENRETAHDMSKKRSRGRQKIPICLIERKDKRNTTFSKRKKGLLKKVDEICTLTDCQALVILVPTTSNVYTYSTRNFQSMLRMEEGRNLILQCMISNCGVVSPERMRPEGYHEKDIGMAIADYRLKKNNGIMDQTIGRLPRKRSAKTAKLAVPQSVQFDPSRNSSQIKRQIHPSAVQHVIPHTIKTETSPINNESFNIRGSTTSAKMRHLGNVSNGTLIKAHNPGIVYRGNNPSNPVNIHSSGIIGNNMSSQGSNLQPHMRYIAENATMRRDSGALRHPYHYGPNDPLLKPNYPVLQRGYPGDPQSEYHYQSDSQSDRQRMAFKCDDNSNTTDDSDDYSDSSDRKC
ncbi:Serum response factor [Trichoplax sp. H2]|nr:Serum response factor [Trichoplax sp. H2]|eukprot:RDD47508.1 Serum response factor [Trichoplax sp. H2]